MPTLPKKLKKDAICEALFEIRFDSTAVPEVLFGRLADHSSWAKFEQRRLPIADIPLLIRNAHPILRYQPMFELVEPAGNRVVKASQHSLAFHVLAPYFGWDQFRPQLHDMIDVLYAKAPEVLVRRLGLRYINAFTAEHHGVAGVQDLNLHVAVADERLQDDLNLNYMLKSGAQMVCTVRVASPSFVEGEKPIGTTAIADVDVFTRDGYRADDAGTVKDWLETAHDTEKTAFFSLLKPETTEALTEG